MLSLDLDLPLAFGFASPWLLWGVVLGGAPILLHLLHRRKPREMRWAAMRFLVAAVQKNQRRIRIEQLLLLAIRVLILLLLALALAQPHVESLGQYFQADVPTHRVLVVDVSFSMGVQETDGTRLERARGMAREIVASSRQGDAINLVRLCQRQPRTIIGQPSFQKSQVLAELDQLQLTEEPGELLPTLQDVVEVLGRASEIPRKEVVFLSDFQSATWKDEATGSEGTRGLLKRIGDLAEVSLIDVGGTDSANAAVIDLAVDEPFLSSGRSATLNATLRNFGSVGLTGVLAELIVDGRIAETRKVDLPAGSPVRTTFQHTFGTAGDHGVEVRISADRLPLDDRRWLSVSVRDELRVLLVDGHSAGKPWEAATWFLQKSLSPMTSRQSAEGLMRPTTISEGEFASADLSKYDCVFLCDLRLITDRETELLKSFVLAGGGLVICPGPQSQPDNYNQVLGPGGADLLPGRIVGRMGNSASPSESFEFDAGQLSHPIVLPFRGNPNAGLESTMTLEYLQLTPATDVGARVVLSFASGDPALVEKTFGQGRVVFWATSANTAWSTGAIQNSFVPLVHETVQFAVSGLSGQKQLLVGEAATRQRPIASSATGATLKGPDEKTKNVAISETDDPPRIVLDSLDKSGLYELSFTGAGGRTDLFAVNVNSRESDLAPTGLSDLRSDLFAGIDVHEGVASEDSNAVRPANSGTARGGLSRWLIWVSFALLFVELLMAWNFRLGLIGLAALLTTIGLLLAVPSKGWLQAAVVGAAITAVIVAAVVRRAGDGHLEPG